MVVTGIENAIKQRPGNVTAVVNRQRMPILCQSKLLFFTLCGIFLSNNLSDACKRQQCTVKQFRFSAERDSLENYALWGFAFKNITVSSRKHCFEQCAWDCRCVSFNYMMTVSQDNCQMNEENRYLRPGALKQIPGHSYHDIVIDYNVKAGTQCNECHNGCCLLNKCLNGGTCLETCGINTKRFQCQCRTGYAGTYCGTVLKSCTDVKRYGGTTDGVYMIDPDGNGPFEVFCNQSNDGEAWAVIQRRLNGSVDFYRGWKEYKQGFGNLIGEFWLGLEKIFRLTNQTGQRMRIEMEDFRGYSCFVEYDNFTVNGEDDGFRLASVGKYKGSCPDSFTYNTGQPFSTKDKDADSNPSTNCAVDHRGAWWYKTCTKTNLNGLYTPIKDQLITGIYWYKTKNQIEILKRTELKIRVLV